MPKLSWGKAAAWAAKGAGGAAAVAAPTAVVTMVPGYAAMATGATAVGVGTAKAASWLMKNQKSPISKTVFGMAAGTAFVAGGVSELFNSDGPWQDVAAGLTGERNYLGYTAKASLSNSFANNSFDYNQGPLDYYNGGNVNPQALHRARRNRLQAPDGSMVMGMYNLRRG